MESPDRAEAQVEEALREEQERWPRIAAAKTPEELERALREPARSAEETARATGAAPQRASRKPSPIQPVPVRRRWWANLVLAVVGVLAIASAVNAVLRSAGDVLGTAANSLALLDHAPGGPPRSSEFSNPRDYAAAMTLHGLRASARTEGRPACGARVTWTDWVCTIRATASTGPSAGRRQTFRCRADGGRRVGGLVIGSTVVCGPTDAPRLGGGAMLPTRERFATARGYASAMTLHLLRASNDVGGRPRCGARATWAEWSCTVRGTPRQGPYAGTPLTFRCRSDGLGAGGSLAGAHCGPIELPGRASDAGPPRPERFATARSYASALTLFVLRAANAVEGRPDCGDQVTWTRWACVVRATPTRGAFAGTTLTYRCRVTSSERAGHRAIARSSECGPIDLPIVP